MPRTAPAPSRPFARPRPLPLLLLALSACATAPRDAAPPADTPPPPADTARVDPARTDPPPRKDGIDQKTAEEETTRILHEVAKARNLAVRSEVTVEVIDRPGIRAFAKASMYEHSTPAELQMLGRIEATLGVIPLGIDPEQIILDLLEDGVLGLYDPKKKTLFIGDFVSKGMLSMVVGHEIAHGLQDMYFDLAKLQEPMRHNSDRESARRFLIEGEAQAAYLAWVGTGGGPLGDAVLDAMGNQVLTLAGVASPYPVLARSLQMPYADGTATVTRLVQRKGWTAVDDMYANLPDSTEQMLHIDKLLARELPVPTKMDSGALDPLLGPAGLKLVWHDDLGEAALLAMLAEVADARPARRAAGGWGGDHFVAYEAAGGKGPTLVAAITTWDSVADAKEFETTFAKYLQEHAAAGHVIERKDRHVVFAAGVPDDLDRAALRKALWKGTHVGKPAKQTKSEVTR